MIPFNKPPYVGVEEKFVLEAMCSSKVSGDGVFTRKSEALLEGHTKCLRALLTPSCTHALELAALLLDIQEDDEVIMPSYTFVSTANAFVLRGAKIVFVDIRPDTMNMDESKIESAITEKTKAIVPVHYAGVACEMDTIMALAKRYNLFVIEDAAQAIGSSYKGRALGSIGHMGTLSFHETKNITSGGEGGALLINDSSFIERAEVIREKGTNRSQFFRGEVDKYSWVDVGSSYLPSELQAAYLYAQLLHVDTINTERLNIWKLYADALKQLQIDKNIELPKLPAGCMHNGHMFYVKVKDAIVLQQLLKYLKSEGITAVFHYVPLHTSVAGKKFGRFYGDDVYTTKESERLIRLPLYYGLSKNDQQKVIDALFDYYK